jgi:hypothetical protein
LNLSEAICLAIAIMRLATLQKLKKRVFTEPNV